MRFLPLGFSFSRAPSRRFSSSPLLTRSHHSSTAAHTLAYTAPEIDIFEALLSGTGKGNVSQSVRSFPFSSRPRTDLSLSSSQAQFAPFNFYYAYTNDDSTDSVKYYNSSKVSGTHDPAGNPYQGGVYQQVASGLSFTNSVRLYPRPSSFFR